MGEYIDYIINGVLVIVGLGFLYLIIMIFEQGIKGMMQGEEDES
jgi:hypothetical protein